MPQLRPSAAKLIIKKKKKAVINYVDRRGPFNQRAPL